MFVVTIDNGGFTYWLRGTVWAGGYDRAQSFATRDAAQAGLAKARPFTKPKLFKLATIREDNLLAQG